MWKSHKLLAFTILAFIILTMPVMAANYHTWDDQNHTATIYKTDKWMNVTVVGLDNGLTEQRETLQISSNYKYSFSAVDNFMVGYKVHKGKSKSSEISTTWYSRIAENYTIAVNDYGINSTWASKQVWNNVTLKNDTIWYWDNQTVVIGNHTEPRSRVNESVFTPTNKKIDAGQILTFVRVTRKKAEVGEFSILITPMFMGQSIPELTWWNGSWPYRIDNAMANGTRPYQMSLTISNGIGTNNATNVFCNGHCNVNFTDIRFTLDNASELPYWIENYTTGALWVNVTGNGTVNMYYGNPSAGSVSNYFNTFDILGDGSSGALTVSSVNTIVNAYAYFTGNEPAGDSAIAINNGTGFSNGDEILIIQMQNYSGGTAGTYEFRKISSGGGTASLTLNSPLKNSYTSGTFDSTTATVTQIVRVPQYTTVTVNNGASITATAWNGYSGGIVAFKANGTVTIVSGGAINTTAQGFRADVGCCVAIGAINGNGSEGYTGKGNYDQLATLGGGGAGKLCDSDNTAGGGGGSYATAGTAGYIQGACTAGAGSTTIFGSSDLSLLFFGGAGGHGYAGPGSNHGGGIILIGANNLSNSGTITSSGGDGGQVIAPSAAGAGGSIFITANTLTAGSSTILATAGAAAIAGAGAGGDGRIRLSSTSITGTTSPTAYTTGFDTTHYRQYASPEPVWATWSSAQTQPQKGFIRVIII